MKVDLKYVKDNGDNWNPCFNDKIQGVGISRNEDDPYMCQC